MRWKWRCSMFCDIFGTIWKKVLVAKASLGCIRYRLPGTAAFWLGCILVRLHFGQAAFWSGYILVRLHSIA